MDTTRKSLHDPAERRNWCPNRARGLPLLPINWRNYFIATGLAAHHLDINPTSSRLLCAALTGPLGVFSPNLLLPHHLLDVIVFAIVSEASFSEGMNGLLTSHPSIYYGSGGQNLS